MTGRHGGAFTNFGDYSVDLFEHIDLYGDPPSRALFDMAAVAIVKNPAWATLRSPGARVRKSVMVPAGATPLPRPDSRFWHCRAVGTTTSTRPSSPSPCAVDLTGSSNSRKKTAPS